MTFSLTSQKNKLLSLGYDIEGMLRFPSTEQFRKIQFKNKRLQDYVYFEPTPEDIDKFVEWSYKLICQDQKLSQ